MELIKRNYQIECRAEENSDGIIRGQAIVYDTATDIGGWFQETICRGAIKEDNLKKDVSLYWNHDYNSKRLARSIIPIEKKGGLALSEDEKGLSFDANLNLKRTDANDLHESIQDGTCSSMSFGFYVKKDHWTDEDTDYPKRFVDELELVEISCVNDPAYPTTSVGLRSNLSSDKDKEALDEMRKAVNHKRNADNNATSELALEKLKAEILYK